MNTLIEIFEKQNRIRYHTSICTNIHVTIAVNHMLAIIAVNHVFVVVSKHIYLSLLFPKIMMYKSASVLIATSTSQKYENRRLATVDWNPAVDWYPALVPTTRYATPLQMYQVARKHTIEK